MKTLDKRGSALVLVLVASMFLIVLTAGAFRYFQTNVDTQIWTRDRIQAKLSAEAGINLATHMLVAGASLPTDSTAQPILGTEASPFVLPVGMGTAYATVDPSNKNEDVVTANAFMIRCISEVPGTTLETFGMASIVMPENLARFSVFMENPTTTGYYGDGYRFDGPFYANGPIRVRSSSATHENDPFFYSLRLTSDYYLAVGSTHQTTPTDGGNLEMRPYHRLCLGAPYFEMGVDPIPFGKDELDWEGVKSAAQSDGLYLDAEQVPSFSRLALKGDTLFVKTAHDAVVDTFPLGDMENPVVWIDNNASDRIFLRGHQNQGLDMGLTIGTNGHVYMSGRLAYENDDPQDPDNTNLLGIMSVEGDMIIADAPDVLPDPAWLGPNGSDCFQIDTDSSFTYYAVLVALEGEVRAEQPYQPLGINEFRLVGGYMCQREGHTNNEGTNPSGFAMAVYFDPRLLFMHPPFFPTTANWNTTMWAEKPDMSYRDVTNGIPEY